MKPRIEVAKNCSFCPGVERALRITEEMLSTKGPPSYSVGPLIHNPEVVSRLRSLGLEVLDPDRLPSDLKSACVVVRSHGIDVETEDELRSAGARVVDATCPKVKRAQKAARDLSDRGYPLLVIGSSKHPEVRSVVGRVEGPVNVLDTAADARSWAKEAGHGVDRVGVVCQTTVSRDLLEDILEVIRSEVEEVEVRDTICDSVADRLIEARGIADRVDLMLVVGGHNSSNTTRLAEACSRQVETHHIESEAEIRPEWLRGVETVGVTGGASTPDWQIEETVRRLERLATSRNGGDR